MAPLTNTQPRKPCGCQAGAQCIRCHQKQKQKPNRPYARTPAAPVKPSRPCKIGIMDKDGISVMGMGGGFKERYFILRESVLKYYDPGDIKMSAPLGQIDLYHDGLSVTIGHDERTITVVAQRMNSDPRIYHFFPRSKQAAKDWHEKLEGSTRAGVEALQRQYERGLREWESNEEKRKQSNVQKVSMQAWDDAGRRDEEWHQNAKEAAAEKDRDVKLQELFNRLDRNGDGTLSAGELCEGFHSDSIGKKVLQDCDENHDGVVSFDEWKSFIYSQSKVEHAPLFGRAAKPKQSNRIQSKKFSQVLASISNNLESSQFEQM